MIEYLIALGCMIVMMLLSWVWIIVSSLLSRALSKTRQRARNRPPRLVCSCPKCHSNLYQDVKGELHGCPEKFQANLCMELALVMAFVSG